uniref:Uncharacterized protein n=1 Tax=Arundo donax TaxID=35708 RepID=A0A0A9A526_ARUDO
MHGPYIDCGSPITCQHSCLIS